ncbi:DUF2306 domain-containing protein [Actinoplanes sp. NPDC024001]|uniref:DUF2306 domain-containing protein n=1 Tax=Actinoplanes sp. NPDC024001 TaxID=3154598 RepID=UPI0033CE1F33
MPQRAVSLLLVVAVVAAAALTVIFLATGPHDAVLVVHVLTAAVALVLGPVQFRARRRWHRAAGRVYLLAGVLPSAVTAIPVAIYSGRPLTQVGLSVAAVLWLITAGLAYRAARRRDLTAHREWMMRNYALTFLAVTARVLVPLMMLAGLATGAGAAPETLIPVGQILGWVVNLAVVEVLIRRRRGAPAVRRTPARGRIMSR